jgi:hypothetical protein
MAKCITTTQGTEAEGYTEIRDKNKNLLVAFNSKDAESRWGNAYQKERIIYCMRHRGDRIPDYLRTGRRTLWLRIFGLKFAAWRLHRINQKEVQNGGESNSNSPTIPKCEQAT